MPRVKYELPNVICCLLGRAGWRMNISTMLASIVLLNQCHYLSIMMKMRIKMSRYIAGLFGTGEKNKKNIII